MTMRLLVRKSTVILPFSDKRDDTTSSIPFFWDVALPDRLPPDPPGACGVACPEAPPPEDVLDKALLLDNSLITPWPPTSKAEEDRRVCFIVKTLMRMSLLFIKDG